MGRISDLYARRIVNVNVNIVAAGLVALVPTAVAAFAAEAYLGVKHPWLMATITFTVDAVADVALYYFLHWFANYMPRGGRARGVSAAYGHLPFLKDATLAQLQRLCLSPLFYSLALGGQFVLASVYGVPVFWATIAGFSIGIMVTRVIHTAWMIRAERRAQARGAGGVPPAPS